MFAGNPMPEVSQIEWYINDVRLYQGDENIRFSDNYLTLYRSKVSGFILELFSRVQIIWHRSIWEISD